MLTINKKNDEYIMLIPGSAFICNPVLVIKSENWKFAPAFVLKDFPIKDSSIKSPFEL